MTVTIAPFTDHHLTRRYVDWLNDPEVTKFSEQRHIEHTQGSCMEYVLKMRKQGLLWAILKGKQHIGNISAHLDEPNWNADISILIGEGRGEGIGTDAFQQVCAHLKHIGYRRLTCGCMARNKPMIAIAKKNGFHIEGNRPAHFLVNKIGVALVEMGKFV